ncbi:MAG: serine/threonine protein kinase, partial [Gemmataceae bacterium]|nr:serine/threonine protein kinase [Gemmataceae bacterium]
MSEPTDLGPTAMKPAHQPPAAVAGVLPGVPGYEAVGEIGRGGMAVVYAARDAALDREVAIKTLQAGMSGRRFEREARITAKLPHPNIPPVYGLGTLPDGRPFLAMKLVRGRTLDALLKERPGPGHDLPRFVQVFEQVCQAVAYAHARGIVHRDLKPLNVMVGEFGEVQVMDWGLAKQLDESGNPTSLEVPVYGGPGDSGRTTDLGAADTDDRTRAGSGWGTPGFMPPEQVEGRWELVDARADVYALGSVLCAVLTGEAAYRGPADAAARLDRCGADPELVALAKQCLSHDPIGRPADAGAVAAAVAAYRAGVADR